MSEVLLANRNGAKVVGVGSDEIMCMNDCTTNVTVEF